MDDRNAQALAAEADSLLVGDEPIEAFELYDRAFEVDSEDVSLLLRAGIALMQAGEFHEAYLYLEQAHNAHPEDPEVLRLMGACALASGQGALARESFERVRDLGSEDTVDLLLDLAVACYFDLQMSAAVGYAAEALELDPSSEEAASWQKKLEGFESDHELIVDVARAHCREGRLGLGAELFSRAFEFGDSFEARLYGGRAMLATGRIDSAVALLSAAVDMRPDDAEAAEELAAASEILQDFDADGDEVAESGEVAAAGVEPATEASSAGTEAVSSVASDPGCPSCGHQLRPDAVFCPSCGRRVG